MESTDKLEYDELSIAVCSKMNSFDGADQRCNMLNCFIFQKSFRDSLIEPEQLITDFAKFERPSQLHLGFQVRISFLFFFSQFNTDQ